MDHWTTSDFAPARYLPFIFTNRTQQALCLDPLSLRMLRYSLIKPYAI